MGMTQRFLLILGRHENNELKENLIKSMLCRFIVLKTLL